MNDYRLAVLPPSLSRTSRSGDSVDRVDAMQVLLAVVDEGSLSAGSRKLGTTLPSVSRKVAELERHLGTQLLIRTSRNIQLTDAGRDYVEATRQILPQIMDAEQRASGEYETPRGELRITVGAHFGNALVLTLAYEFLRLHPEITLDILSADRIVNLTEEHVDVGIRIGPLTDDYLIAVKVGTVRIVTCASPEYLERKRNPSSLEDLEQHDVIQLGQLAWTTPDGTKIPKMPSLVRVHATDATTACKAAIQGLGIARAPSFMISDELRSGALVEILRHYAPTPKPVHLVYVKQGLLALKVRAFIDWMAPRLRQKLAEFDASR